MGVDAISCTRLHSPTHECCTAASPKGLGGDYCTEHTVEFNVHPFIAPIRVSTDDTSTHGGGRSRERLGLITFRARHWWGLVPNKELNPGAMLAACVTLSLATDRAEQSPALVPAHKLIHSAKGVDRLQPLLGVEKKLDQASPSSHAADCEAWCVEKFSIKSPSICKKGGPYPQCDTCAFCTDDAGGCTVCGGPEGVYRV